MGAALCVAVMLLVTIFTPYRFMAFSVNRLLIGGVIAFALAWTGARLGEKLTGSL